MTVILPTSLMFVMYPRFVANCIGPVIMKLKHYLHVDKNANIDIEASS